MTCLDEFLVLKPGLIEETDFELLSGFIFFLNKLMKNCFRIYNLSFKFHGNRSSGLKVMAIVLNWLGFQHLGAILGSF